MKFTLIAILPIAFAGSIRAQFTMTPASHEKAVGLIETVVQFSLSSGFPPTTGMAQTWDFSNSFNIIIDTIVTSFVTPASLASSSMYPTSNLADKDGVFFRESNTQSELLGDIYDTLTDPKIVMKWPLSFGSSWSDSHHGPYTDGILSGTTNGTVTGFGTLKLPGNITHPNCMQLFTIETETTTGSTFFPDLATKHTRYRYYTQSNRFPVFTAAAAEFAQGSASVVYNIGYLNIQTITSIKDHFFEPSFVIFPNPADNDFNMRLKNPQGAEIKVTVYDPSGAVRKNVYLGVESEIDQNISIADLPAGVYFVKTFMDEKYSVLKLVKE